MVSDHDGPLGQYFSPSPFGKHSDSSQVAGLAVGALSLLVPMYQAETAPRHIRGALIS